MILSEKSATFRDHALLVFADVDQNALVVTVGRLNHLVLPAALVGRVGRGRDRGAEQAEAEAAKSKTVVAVRGGGRERCRGDDGGGGDGEDGLAEHGSLSWLRCDVRHILHFSRRIGPRGSKARCRRGPDFSSKCSICWPRPAGRVRGRKTDSTFPGNAL